MSIDIPSALTLPNTDGLTKLRHMNLSESNQITHNSAELMTSAAANFELFCRKSLNITDYVGVPSSEHVAEIVGRQGCKIKALRNRTNTYIKTPARGEQPVFVITGRRSDVTQARTDILLAAEHFTQIRACRGHTKVISSLPSSGEGTINSIKHKDVGKSDGHYFNDLDDDYTHNSSEENSINTYDSIKNSLDGSPRSSESTQNSILSTTPHFGDIFPDGYSRLAANYSSDCDQYEDLPSSRTSSSNDSSKLLENTKTACIVACCDDAEDRVPDGYRTMISPIMVVSNEINELFFNSSALPILNHDAVGGNQDQSTSIGNKVTVQLRVPYRIVGLVVGPKGATIKRIQQNTQTYIVTPSKDRDPVFEITGTSTQVVEACRQIEAHVIARTGIDMMNTSMPSEIPLNGSISANDMSLCFPDCSYPVDISNNQYCRSQSKVPNDFDTSGFVDLNLAIEKYDWSRNTQFLQAMDEILPRTVAMVTNSPVSNCTRIEDNLLQREWASNPSNENNMFVVLNKNNSNIGYGKAQNDGRNRDINEAKQGYEIMKKRVANYAQDGDFIKKDSFHNNSERTQSFLEYPHELENLRINSSLSSNSTLQYQNTPSALNMTCPPYYCFTNNKNVYLTDDGSSLNHSVYKNFQTENAFRNIFAEQSCYQADITQFNCKSNDGVAYENDCGYQMQPSMNNQFLNNSPIRVNCNMDNGFSSNVTSMPMLMTQSAALYNLYRCSTSKPCEVPMDRFNIVNHPVPNQFCSHNLNLSDSVMGNLVGNFHTG